ncbi:MAG: PAS domain-containing protein, partial [Candidatus Omnitrophica bacterium]|nr:PAS domain-containing protein [Candidatus Omnitrophota bacterium]
AKKPFKGLENINRSKNGNLIILETSGVPITDKDGNLTGFRGIDRDVTERKQMEAVLKESEAQYRIIFENTGTSMCIIEGDMTVSMVNGEFEKHFGISKKEVEHKKNIVEFVDDEFKDKVIEYHRLRTIDPGAVPRNYEIKMKNNNGNVKDIYLTVAIIPGTRRSVVSLLDISELKRKETELRKQKELLDNTNRALEHKLNELQDALGHIKKLEGLVPICARCKKMLIEKGDPKDPNAWVALEKYISERSKASFTHGICPNCANKMYSDMHENKEKM